MFSLKSSLALSAFVLLTGTGLSAHATTIGFSGAPIGGGFTGPITESGYVYRTVSGSVYANIYGNPGTDMEGQISNGGGALGFTAVSGDFSFSSVDFSDENAAETITVSGYLSGVLVGVDTYSLPDLPFSGAFTYTTENASNLAGKTLDDLTITLPAQSAVSGAAAIDNVVLNAATATTTTTPEPSSIVLLGSGLLGVAAAARRRLTR